MPFYVVVPMTLILCVSAAYAAHFVWWDILTFLGFSVLGYLMKLFDWPRPPVLVAVVLGGQLEGYLWLSNARYGWRWLLEPSVLAIMALVILTLVMPIIKRLRHGQPAGGEPIVVLTRWHRLGDIVFLLAIMAVLVAAADISTDWVLRASLVIYCLAALGVALGAVQIIMNLRLLRVSASDDSPIDIEKASSIARRTVESFAWLIGLAAGVWLIGFHLTVGAFAILFVRVYGGPWRVSLIIAGLAEGFVFAVFDWLLEVFWPVPVLFEPFIESWF